VTATETVTEAPVLHVPEEPGPLAERWLAKVRSGVPFDETISGDDGISSWLWSRWRSLAVVGIDEDEFERIVRDYRRELWLWLAGERTWAQCCGGLIGRIDRRIPTGE
jgi:hypothetical protein